MCSSISRNKCNSLLLISKVSFQFVFFFFRLSLSQSVYDRSATKHRRSICMFYQCEVKCVLSVDCEWVASITMLTEASDCCPTRFQLSASDFHVIQFVRRPGEKICKFCFIFNFLFLLLLLLS